MTRNSIFDAVRGYSGRKNLSDADLQIMTDAATGELSSALVQHPRNMIVGAVWTVGSENPELVPLPDDCLVVRTLEKDGVRYEQYPTGYDMTNAIGYIEKGTHLKVHPTPDEGDTFEIDYHAAVPMLVSAEDTNWLSVFFPNLYIYAVLVQLATWTKDAENRSIWEAEYRRALEDVRRQGWNQNVSDSPRTRSM